MLHLIVLALQSLENKAESQQDRHDDDKGKPRKDKDRQEGVDRADIVTAIAGWATVTDIHVGFQRLDGRNLLGFNDGVSNPRPGSGDKFDSVVWTREG